MSWTSPALVLVHRISSDLDSESLHLLRHREVTQGNQTDSAEGLSQPQTLPLDFGQRLQHKEETSALSEAVRETKVKQACYKYLFDHSGGFLHCYESKDMLLTILSR